MRRCSSSGLVQQRGYAGSGARRRCRWLSKATPALVDPSDGRKNALGRALTRSRTVSGDPVASLMRPVRRESYVVEDGARPLNHDGRPRVVVVARQEHTLDSLGARDDECLTEHLSGIATTALARPDAKPDVAAEVPQERVQLATYRDAADEIGAHLSDKEGRRHPIRRHLKPTAELLKPVEVCGPWLIGPPVQEEVELLACEFFVGNDCVPFVAHTQRA
jgi:hypothetical protein